MTVTEDMLRTYPKFSGMLMRGRWRVVSTRVWSARRPALRARTLA